MDLQTNKVIAVEALCRCSSEKMKGIYPQEFIKVAEETGQMDELGAFIFSTAVTEAREKLFPANDKLYVHINISTKQLHDDKLLRLVNDTFNKDTEVAEKFTFELTETAIMQDTQLLVDQLNELSKLGSRVSVDDFGTGYSSLSWLKNLPVSSLKIDKEFIDEVLTNTNEAAITKAIIELGENLDLVTIAEGIETKEQLDYLKEHNCLMGQGYYFSKPMIMDKLVKFLKDNNQ